MSDYNNRYSRYRFSDSEDTDDENGGGFDDDYITYEDAEYDDIDDYIDDSLLDEDIDSFGDIGKQNYARGSSGKGKAGRGKAGKKAPKHPVLSELLSYVKIIIAAFIIAFIFTQYIIVNAQVPTGSMKNTIMEGDRLIGFRLSYIFSKPERGDIIIFKYPDDETQNFVKRVIGVPGDVVQIIHGDVYVNGEELDEPYIKEPMYDNETEETYVVPEGHYFVMGDNRNDSLDSRYWKTSTFVSEKKILAKVIFRYYNEDAHKIDFKLL